MSRAMRIGSNKYCATDFCKHACSLQFKTLSPTQSHLRNTTWTPSLKWTPPTDTQMNVHPPKKESPMGHDPKLNPQ